MDPQAREQALEVTSVLRRQLHSGRLTADQATAAVIDVIDLPIRVFPTTPLLARAWDLRNNLSAHDACHVALAEALDTLLLTADRRLSTAPGIRCSVEVL